MQFVNSEIQVTDLPSVERTALHPVAPEYLKIQRIEWSITTGMLAAILTALVVFVPGMKALPVLLPTVCACLILVLFYRLIIEKSFPWKGYAIREHDIIYQHGWLIRSVKTVPFSRIQNCTINAGPLERRYNLSCLSIYTAGTSGADMKISGLTTESAESIREFVLRRIDDETR
jgi:uncharacterized protein